MDSVFACNGLVLVSRSLMAIYAEFLQEQEL
jgi:hypothetical protein